MREGGLLVAGGLVVGVPAALAAAQVIRAQLYGVGPSDPHIFILVSTVLGMVACVAMLMQRFARAASIRFRRCAQSEATSARASGSSCST